MQLEDYSIIAWIKKNGIKTETGKPYDLKHHPFWFEPLRDWSPRIVELKAAQMGGSIKSNLKLFFAMDRWKMNSIYTLPTTHDANEFVSGKTNPLIANNPCLAAMVEDKDSVEQKRIGKNTVYFRGTWVDRAALSVSSDLNIYDEEDRSKPAIIDQYASRLQHSDYKWEWHLSNPSAPGNGVDKYWSISDKKHWFIQCSRCMKKQYLSWPDSIDIEAEIFVCKHCHEPLRDEDRTQGDWHKMITATKPEYSGYWYSLLTAPWISAKQIIALSREKSPEYFSNFVLGLPFIGSGSKLTEDQFFANLTSTVNDQSDPIVIGVDPGLPIWFCVGNRKGLFYWGKSDGYDEIERLMHRFPRAIVVSDQGGDLIGMRQLQQKYPGRVYLAYYRADRRTMTLVDWGKGEENGKVVVDRNRMIQLVIDELRDQRIPIQGDRADWQEAWLHFANIYRTVVEDAAGNERFVWERSGPDHLVHAMVYWRAGMDKFGMSESLFVTPSKVFGDLPRSAAVTLDGKFPALLMPSKSKERDWREV